MNDKILVAPSVLSADWGRLNEEINAINSAGADLIHLDVMDGSFVPPITFGADFVKACKAVSKVPLDVHLMINSPEKHLEIFAKAGANYITVHLEACSNLLQTIQKIKDLGCKAGVAINPATAVYLTKDIVAEIDLLLVMTVNPGWGGQSFITSSEQKIRDALELIKKEKSSALIEVDGGINEQTARICTQAGATILVAGTYIFKSSNYQERITSLKN